MEILYKVSEEQQGYCVKKMKGKDNTKCVSFMQVLQANSLKHAVQILGIRPEQLSSDDLEGHQVQKPQWCCCVSIFHFQLLRNHEGLIILCFLFSLDISADGRAVLQHQSASLALSVLLVLPHCCGTIPPSQCNYTALCWHALHSCCWVPGKLLPLLVLFTDAIVILDLKSCECFKLSGSVENQSSLWYLWGFWCQSHGRDDSGTKSFIFVSFRAGPNKNETLLFNFENSN